VSAFDDIRARLAGWTLANQLPLNIESMMRHWIGVVLAQYREWPDPHPVFVDDFDGVMLWARYRNEVDELTTVGFRGEALGRELALRTAMTHERALGFVRWLENTPTRSLLRELEELLQPRRSYLAEAVLAELIQEAKPQPPPPRKTAPPVPPWARERGRKRRVRPV